MTAKVIRLPTPFERKLDAAVSKAEDWIDAEPPPCAGCGHPYSAHSDGEELCPVSYDAANPSSYIDGEVWEVPYEQWQKTPLSHLRLVEEP